MKNRLVTSLFFMIAGLLLILIPLYILPVCPPPEVSPIPMEAMMQNGHAIQSGPAKIMKCFWTARAELGIGLVIMVIGLLMFFSRTVFVRMGLSMSIACIAILAAAIPTVLIGVCSSEMMRCNMGTKPALVLMSGLIFIVAVINTFYLNKIAKK